MRRVTVTFPFLQINFYGIEMPPLHSSQKIVVRHSKKTSKIKTAFSKKDIFSIILIIDIIIDYQTSPTATSCRGGRVKYHKI